MKKIRKFLAFLLTIVLVLGEFAGTGIKAQAGGDDKYEGLYSVITASASYKEPQIGEALPEVKYTLLTPTNKGLFLTFGGWIYLTENKKWELYTKPYFEAGSYMPLVEVSSESYKNNAGYSASVNAAGDIVVAYSGNDLSAKKLKIGSLDFKLKLEGINATVETTAVKLKAAKSSPKVKAASVKLLEESVSGNTVIQSVYKDRSGKLRNLEPVNIEIKPTSKLEASFDPADKMLISVKELKANKGSVTLKISYRGGVTKKLVIKVKKAK